LLPFRALYTVRRGRGDARRRALWSVGAPPLWPVRGRIAGSHFSSGERVRTGGWPIPVLDPVTTALIVVDLQHGILSLPLTPHGGDQVLARCAELGHALANAGGIIVLVNVAYSDGYADRPNQPADAPMGLPADGLPVDWSTLAPAIAGLPAQVRITKRQQSAFFGTELDLQLRRRGVVTVVVCGVATNFGVEATVRDAHNLNYAVVIPSDACTSVSPGLHDFAVTWILPRFARVRDSAEILDWLGTSPQV